MSNTSTPADARSGASPAARNVAIRYDQSSVTHTSQFLLSPGDEELIMDLSSGLIRETRGSETLPIHTRLSMSWSTAERLSGLLNQVLAQRESSRQAPVAGRKSTPGKTVRRDTPIASGKPNSVPAPKFPQAALPRVENTTSVG